MNEPKITLARERVGEWKPITNPTCTAGGSVFGAPHWRPDGRSSSCSYCGSMSTEEVLESLGNPDVQFSMADEWRRSGRRTKFYVRRYPHAGACSKYCECGEPDGIHRDHPRFSEGSVKFWRRGPIGHPFKLDRRKGGCACEVERGGGPIKFYANHLLDFYEDRADADMAYRRLVVRSQEDHARLMAEIDERTRRRAAEQAEEES